jgi:hypothetical protein
MEVFVLDNACFLVGKTEPAAKGAIKCSASGGGFPVLALLQADKAPLFRDTHRPLFYAVKGETHPLFFVLAILSFSYVIISEKNVPRLQSLVQYQQKASRTREYSWSLGSYYSTSFPCGVLL